jgi:uridine kinase
MKASCAAGRAVQRRCENSTKTRHAYKKYPTFAAKFQTIHKMSHLSVHHSAPVSDTAEFEQPYIIGICGGSGSGKTSFIRRIREDFLEGEVCIVSQDDYYFPREKQKKDGQGIANFDLPKSVDKKSLLLDLQQLIEGQSVTRQEYVFNNDLATAKTRVFHPAPVLIVEGLFVFHYKKIFRLFDLRVFINAKENLKIIRRIKRDQVERNYPVSDVLYRYENHVLPAYERFIEPYRDSADIVVNNNENFDASLSVINGFIRSKLADNATNAAALIA